jgi:uncharacterized protein (DUF302 family)
MRLAAAIIPLLLFTHSALADQLVTIESKHSVKETLDRLTATLDKRGIKPVARVDHAAGAKAVGMELPPTEVLIFGNPKLGTPLMQSNPEIGIDLPMRVLAWQDKAGKVWVAYTAPDTLKARHGITDRDEIFNAMAKALQGLTKAASGQ